MSTSWQVIIKRFAVLAIVALVLLGIVEIFAYDIIKIQWPGFMSISPARKQMYDPLPVPAQAIPIEGPAYIPNGGAPTNPVKPDDVSLARGQELFNINCTACHGTAGKGDGPVAAFLQNKKPIDLTGPIGISLSDGAIFMTITNGTPGGMPALNENLTVRERWDVVNYVRELQQQK
jgi:mono/diheme cytochrome c family protein